MPELLWSPGYVVYFLSAFANLEFRRGRSTVDQVVLLMQNIEDCFQAKKKAGAVFVDLTAAYDTVSQLEGIMLIFVFLAKIKFYCEEGLTVSTQIPAT